MPVLCRAVGVGLEPTHFLTDELRDALASPTETHEFCIPLDVCRIMHLQLQLEDVNVQAESYI